MGIFNALRARQACLATLLCWATLCLASSPARAAGFCDRYAETLSEKDRQSYADKLRLPLPALYASALSRVRIENNPDLTVSMPLTHPPLNSSGAPVILLPAGFQRLHCKLVQVDHAYRVNSFKRDGSLQLAFNACMAQGGRRGDCLVKALDRKIASMDPKLTSAPDYEQTIRYFVESSFLFILEHEAGHILFEAGGDGLVAKDLNEETAADLLAFLALSANNADVSASIGVFGTWGIADDSINWEKEAHPSFECRSYATYYMWREIVPSLALIYSFMRDPDKYAAAKAAAARETPIPAAPPEHSTCWASTAPQVAKIRKDIDAVLAAIDQATTNSVDDQAALAKLVAVRPVTQQVRGLRDSLIASWTYRVVSNYLERFSAMDNINSVSDFRRKRAMLQRIGSKMLDTVDREIDGRLMSSGVYGSSVAGNELLRMGLAGSFDEARLTAKLSILKRYSPGSGFTPYFRGLIELKHRNCRAAYTLLREAAAIDSYFQESLDNISNMADQMFNESFEDGKCAKFAQYL